LSCHRIPSYPDNQAKARNGYYFGDDGYNGKHGLDSYNGGSLIIVSGNVIDASNI
jgi:hypothetical protein